MLAIFVLSYMGWVIILTSYLFLFSVYSFKHVFNLIKYLISDNNTEICKKQLEIQTVEMIILVATMLTTLIHM